MPFIDCLTSAVDQGALTREEAAELSRDFDRRFAQARLQMGDEPAAAAAKEALEKELRADAAERRRRVLLTEAARVALARDLRGYRSPTGQPDILGAALQKLSSYGTAGYSSLRGRFEAILGLAHAELADHIRTFRRTMGTGRRLNRPLADDVMRELHGEATGKPEAKGLADALGRVAEDLRQRFNAAGGAIPKLDKWGWTHSHNRQAIGRAGRDEWKRITRPLLDEKRMIDPLTGDPADVGRLLDVVWENIVSDSWARHQPAMRPFGRGALSGQRQEHRYLIFKSADAWLEYDRSFGSADPVASWFEHIKGMARDIAAMETFGPNPQAMVEWMKQAVRAEIGKKQAGISSLAKKAGIDSGAHADWRIDALYEYLRGRPTVSSRMARLTGDVRNTMTAALLGSASVLAAATDPFIERAARKLAGLPMRGALTAGLKTFSSGPRDQAVRAGFIADDFVHILRDEARYAGFLDGNEWSRILADRAVTWSLLKPLTEARRHVHQLEWQATLADHAAATFDRLPDLLRRAMRGFGIDATDWDVMRSTPLFKPAKNSAGLLRPVDVAALGEGPALPQVQKLLGVDEADAAIAAEQVRAGVRRTAEKYVEMVQSWTERAVPAGTPNARSFVTGAAKRGTIAGELLEGLLQFKSFTLSFTTLQIQAAVTMAAAKGRWSAAKYAGGLAIGMTLGGALYMHLKSLADGKDPEDMRRPAFWTRALLAGGGLGIFGDFLFASYARDGMNPLASGLGPGVGFAEDLAGLTIGNIGEAFAGKDTHAGREFRNFLGRYTPVLSTHWATRGAWNRIFLDQLQYLTDPAARQSFAARIGNLKRETGQDYWWRPGGGPTPQRQPDLGAVVGR